MTSHNSDKFVETRSVTDINNTEMEVKNKNDEFQVVSRRNSKKHRKPNIGSGAEVNETFRSFKSEIEPKKIWLFISRVNESVEETGIKNYISGKSASCVSNTDKISVKLLETKSNQAGFRSYMVGVPMEVKEEVYKNEFWPIGVSFNRFNFMRGQKFLEQRSLPKSPPE